jgi:DNA-binding response OmpR family regulator
MTLTLVMAVDDAQDVLEFVRRVAEAAGYAFVGARSGQQCVDFVTCVKPGVLLLDIDMPEMDGFDTCRRVRAISGFKDVPIIFLTGADSPNEFTRAAAAGGNDFIIKPASPALLRARLTKWISRSGRRTMYDVIAR